MSTLEWQLLLSIKTNSSNQSFFANQFKHTDWNVRDYAMEDEEVAHHPAFSIIATPSLS
jgi:hypothetical protein